MRWDQVAGSERGSRLPIWENIPPELSTYEDQQMRVLIADSHDKVRWALRKFIEEETEFTIVGEASDAETLFSRTEILQPDLILLEWELTGVLADTLLPALYAITPEVRVIVLSSRWEPELIALKAGAVGFAHKANGPEKLMESLLQLAQQMFP